MIRRPSTSTSAASWLTSSWKVASPTLTPPVATMAASLSGRSRRRWWSAIRVSRLPSPRSCRLGLPRTPRRLGPCSTSPFRSAASITSTTICCTTWGRASRPVSRSTVCGSSAPRRRPRAKLRSSASPFTTTPRNWRRCSMRTPRLISCSCRSTTSTGRATSSSRVSATRCARSAGFPWSSWSR